MAIQTLLEQLTRESKYAWRRIRSSPGPTVFAILTLAIGIGVTVATYSVVYSGLWRPLGIADESRVRLIGRTNSLRLGSRPVSWPDYQALAADPKPFATAAAWTTFSSVLVTPGSAALASGEVVTGGYFPMLGLQPVHGRFLTPDDDRTGAKAVVVLSYPTWRDQFAADPAAVGKTIKIGTTPFEVVGVAPSGFRGVHADGFAARDVWVPMVWSGMVRLSSRPSVTAGVRLAADQTPDGAAKDMNAIGARLDASVPLPETRVSGAPPQPTFRYWTTALPTDDQGLNSEDAVGRLIVGLPALVLLIACTNIANLVLSRGVARRHDFGVRRALGASRWRLIREQLVEQSAIVVVGGAAGVLVAHGLVRLAAGIARENLGPFLRGAQFDWSLDAGVLSSTAVAVLLSIVVSGLIPALHLTRDSLRTVLDQGGNAATPRWRGRANLIALQVGVSVGLFLVAVIFIRMLVTDPQLKREIARMTPGADRVAVAPIPFGIQQRDAARAAATVDQVLADVRNVPGVEVAGAMSDQPFGRGMGTYNVIDGRVKQTDAAPDAESLGSRLTSATPGGIASVGRKLSSGRDFNEADTRDAAPVAMVNEGLALDLFGTADVAGREMVLNVMERSYPNPAVLRTATVRIVGVTDGAQTVRSGNGRVAHAREIYLPFSQQHQEGMVVFARAPSGALAPVDALRDAIRKADPELAVSFVASAAVLEGGPMMFLGYTVTVLTTIAFLALGLSMAGLYGVLSHVVARRTREMGIRIAIGASTGRIQRLVLRDGFRPILEGLFIGLATATVIRVFLKSTLSAKDVVPIDPLACLAAAGLVAIAGAIACYLPARRAASVDPNVALRNL